MNTIKQILVRAGGLGLTLGLAISCSVMETEEPVAPVDSGRHGYTALELPMQMSIAGSDPQAIARNIYGTTEPVKGNFQETVDLVTEDATAPVVVVTQTGLSDDSVYGVRYRLEFIADNDQWRITWIGRQLQCQPGRGHQEWTPTPCQ
jgi:hypothetical protein